MVSPDGSATTAGTDQAPRVVALYQPRFHQLPEHDAWYGDGFSEWGLVAGAQHVTPGHGPPRLPGELGFYDLRVPQTRLAQARLARQHGVHGFLYSHYWFGGRELFERPADEVLRSGSPAFPFALWWCNESLRRTTGELLVEQTFDEDDDIAHIDRLMEYFKDPRYIRLGDRPLLVVSSVDRLPDAVRTAAAWRERCAEVGVGAPWLVLCESDVSPGDPSAWGFDASMEMPLPRGADRLASAMQLPGLASATTVVEYQDLVTTSLGRPDPAWIRYPCVATGWDSAPRHPAGGALMARDATPERYGQWLGAALSRQAAVRGGAGLVFVNAWNDWANGAHLEPDTHHGRRYLEVTREVVERVVGIDPHPDEAAEDGAEAATPSDALYPDLARRHAALQSTTSGLLAHAERRLQRAEAGFAADLATARDEARRLAALNASLEEQVKAQAAQADELRMLLEERPLRPAVQRSDDEGAGGHRVEPGGPGASRYLELLKASLTRILFLNDAPGRDIVDLAQQRAVRMIGKDWPEDAETMIGILRLDCIQSCVETVLRDQVAGDLLEAGVWRGGATIFMKGILAAHGVTDRRVWVADSFQGLPPPDGVNFPQDIPEDLSSFDELAVSLHQVKANFARYDLLDDSVEFVEGWFKDTLPAVPVDALAVLRLDGDYYESTIQILESLYHKVSPGGFVIVDDYGCIEACRQAVTDFRQANGIDDEIVPVDWTGVYWRRALT